MNYIFSANGQGKILPLSVIKNKIKTATETELRVLMYIITLESDASFSATDIQSISGIELEDVISALQFWRGAEVLQNADSKETNSTPIASSNTNATNGTKALRKDDIPNYSGEEIAKLFDENGEIKLLIDECQKIAGKIFNPHETNKIVALYDYLGLSAEYILSLFSYCKSKGKTTVPYLEKTAYNLYNEGIDSDERLREYLKNKEEFDSIVGKVRRIFGIGSRKLLKREEDMIKKWTELYSYKLDIIEYAYELTVKATNESSLPYASKILENWFKAGITTLDQAKEQDFEYKKSKQNEQEQKTETSFDNDEFFEAALRNSYKNLGIKPTDNKG